MGAKVFFLQSLGFTASMTSMQGGDAHECVTHSLWEQMFVIAILNQLLKFLATKIITLVFSLLIVKCKVPMLHEAVLFLGVLLASASYFVTFLFAANASNDTGLRIALSCVVGVLGRHVIVPVVQSYRTAKAAQRGLKEVLAEKRRALSTDPGARDADETCTQRRASERMKAVEDGELEIAPLGLQEGALNEWEKKLEQPDENLEPNVKTGNDDDRDGDKEIPVLEQGDAALARPEQEHAAEGRKELEQPDAKREPSVKQQVKVKKK